MADEEKRAARAAGVPQYIRLKCVSEFLLQTGRNLGDSHTDSRRMERPPPRDSGSRVRSAFDTISADRPSDLPPPPRLVGIEAGADPRLQAQLQRLVDRRQICRRTRDFEEADALRRECNTRQVRVDDGMLTWYGPNHTGGTVRNPDPRQF